MTKHQILLKPISELATSNELLKLPMFGFRMYKELLSVLKAYKLESELIED